AATRDRRTSLRRDPAAGHGGGRRLDRFDDVVVTRAAAEIALQPLADLALGRAGVALEQVRRRHHHARRAEAALQAVIVLEGLLDDAERAVRVGHALDRPDLRALARGGEDRAGLDAVTIYMDDAGAALAGVAADM